MTNEPDLPQAAEDGAAPAIESAVNTLSPDTRTKPPASSDYDLMMAADNAAKCIAAFDEDMTPAAMREALRRAILTDAQGEAKLQLQAQVVDALFHRLAQKALTAPRWKQKERIGYIDVREVELALRAQALCRSTYDSLRKIKSTSEKKDSPK